MKALGFALVASLISLASVSYAAPVPADRMLCEDAIEQYEENGRIWVVGASPRDIVPIYGMKPASKWREVRCTGRGKTRKSYWVPTLDDRTCVIAVYCG